MGNLYTEWSFQVIDGRTMLPVDDDTGIYNVLKAGDPTHETIYVGENDTTADTQDGATPPVLSNGRARFFTTNDITSVDFAVLTAKGEFVFAEDMTPSNHRIVVYPDQPDYMMVIPYFGTSGVTETGFRIWDNMVVNDCFLRAYVGGTAVSMDIGTSTDPNGFLDAAVASTTGWKVLDPTAGSGAALIKGQLIIDTTGHRLQYIQANTTSGSTIVYDNVASEVAAAEGYIFISYKKALAAS